MQPTPEEIKQALIAYSDEKCKGTRYWIGGWSDGRVSICGPDYFCLDLEPDINIRFIVDEMNNLSDIIQKNYDKKQQ